MPKQKNADKSDTPNLIFDSGFTNRTSLIRTALVTVYTYSITVKLVER